MSSEDEQDAVGEELAREQRNIANAKWVFDYEGKVLPVTNLFDSEGEATNDHVLACSCVAYDAAGTHPNGKWLCFGNLEPGEVWSKV